MTRHIVPEEFQEGLSKLAEAKTAPERHRAAVELQLDLAKSGIGPSNKSILQKIFSKDAVKSGLKIGLSVAAGVGLGQIPLTGGGTLSALKGIGQALWSPVGSAAVAGTGALLAGEHLAKSVVNRPGRKHAARIRELEDHLEGLDNAAQARVAAKKQAKKNAAAAKKANQGSVLGDFENVGLAA